MSDDKNNKTSAWLGEQEAVQKALAEADREGLVTIEDPEYPGSFIMVYTTAEGQPIPPMGTADHLLCPLRVTDTDGNSHWCSLYRDHEGKCQHVKGHTDYPWGPDGKPLPTDASKTFGLPTQGSVVIPSAPMPAARYETVEDWATAPGWWNKGSHSAGFIPEPSCTHEPTKAFKLDGVTYYGGERTMATKAFDGLVVGLLGARTQEGPLDAPDDWLDVLEPHVYGPPKDYLSLDWRDREAPPVTPAFFAALHAEVLKRKIKAVCFHCWGGHGRTGTALTAMILATRKGFSQKQAIAYVRKHYCKKAVESEAQEKFLQSVVDWRDAT